MEDYVECPATRSDGSGNTANTFQVEVFFTIKSKKERGAWPFAWLGRRRMGTPIDKACSA